MDIKIEDGTTCYDTKSRKCQSYTQAEQPYHQTQVQDVRMVSALPIFASYDQRIFRFKDGKCLQEFIYRCWDCTNFVARDDCQYI